MDLSLAGCPSKDPLNMRWRVQALWKAYNYRGLSCTYGQLVSVFSVLAGQWLFRISDRGLSQSQMAVSGIETNNLCMKTVYFTTELRKSCTVRKRIHYIIFLKCWSPLYANKGFCTVTMLIPLPFFLNHVYSVHYFKKGQYIDSQPCHRSQACMLLLLES